ncbi:MAG: hypothetical protein Q7J07_02125 [Pelolinea sp.]|nr:hypothetical protein [Pelolinea sp.]
MTISIDKITVRDLGPVKQFDHPLGKINLIYGHNEKGKTLLVEFIIRSLFKRTKMWPMRDIHGEGGVTVSGLEDTAIQIKPKSAKKLEDYWDISHSEFPQDMSKLLVVRAAEVELSDEDDCGIGKQILLEYLSGKGVIDSIQGKIMGVLKNATLEDGMIVGAREQGIKKDLSKKDEEIARVEAKFEQVNTRFSQGRLQELRTTEGVLVEKFEALR